MQTAKILKADNVPTAKAYYAKKKGKPLPDGKSDRRKKQIAELDRIFKRIYEDNISGAISHDRFLKLIAEYEAEQRELEEKVKSKQREVNTYKQFGW